MRGRGTEGAPSRVTLAAGVLAVAVWGCAAPGAAPDTAAQGPERPAVSGAPERAPAEPAVQPGGSDDETTADAAGEAVAPPAPPEPAPPEPAPPAPAPPDAPALAPAPPDAAVPAPASPAPAPPGPAPQWSASSQPARVVVSRIGVDGPLVPVGLHPDDTLVVPDQASVAGWYTGAPRPGDTGPSVIAGHNVWGGAQGVFARLHELVPGDVVEVHHHDGSVVRFLVERVEQHPKEAFPSERVYGDTARPEVRVITCGGAFDRGRDAHLDNIIVFGVRIS